jgi:hypothetical protein
VEAGQQGGPVDRAATPPGPGARSGGPTRCAGRSRDRGRRRPPSCREAAISGDVCC